MGYSSSEDGSDKPSGLRKGLGWLAGIVAFLIAKAVVGGFMHEGFRSSFQTDGQIKANAAASLEKNPTLYALYAAMKRDFPERYDAFLDTIVTNIRSGKTELEARAEGQAFMQRTIKENAASIRAAPTENLVRIAQLQSAVSDSLQITSVAQCAHFTNAGFKSDDIVAPETMLLLSQLGAATLDAARAGIDHPVTQRTLAIETSDAQALNAAVLQQGLSAAQLEAFGADKIATLPEIDQCAIGVAAYKAIIKLPAETMANVTATLVGA